MKNWIWASALCSALLLGCGDSSQTNVLSEPVKAQARLSALTAGSNYDTAVQQLYIAYFGRPADPGGLTNFAAALAAANAPTSIQDLSAAYAGNPAIRSLVNAFATSAESNALYNGSTTEFVNAIYQNVLNRSADPEGLKFWVNAIDTGSLTKGNAAISIMAGALANTSAQGLLDRDTVNNKVAVGASFTSLLISANQIAAYSGDGAAAVTRTMLANVNASTKASEYQATVSNTVTALAASAGTSTNASPFAGTYTVSNGEVTISFLVGTDGSISSCFSTTSVVCSGTVSSSGALNLSGNDGETPVDTSATLTGMITASGLVSGSFTGTSMSDGAFSGNFQGSRTSNKIPINVQPVVQNGESAQDAAGDNSTLGRIGIGIPISGSTNSASNDLSDRFAVTLTAGVDYILDLSGKLRNASDFSQTWYVLGVYSSDNILVTRAHGFGTTTTTEARVRFRPAVTGTYYVEVQHPELIYSLSAIGFGGPNAVPPTEWKMWHQPGTTESYNLGTATAGYNILMYLSAGKTYNFKATTTRTTWNSTLLDLQGNVKASGQNISFTPTEDGLYRLSGTGNGTFAVQSSETSAARSGTGGGSTTPENPTTASCKASSTSLGSGPVVMVSGKSDVPVACFKNRLDTFGWTGFDNTAADACRGAQDPKRNGDFSFYKAKNVSACYCMKNGKVNTLTQGYVCWVFFDSGLGPN